MKPKNDGFQKESPFFRDLFSGSMLNFARANVNKFEEKLFREIAGWMM